MATYDKMIDLSRLSAFKDKCDTAYAAKSHSHGSIDNSGAISSDTTVASGDKLIISDSSDSSKIKRSNISFGTDTSKYLRNDGTWQTVSSGGDIFYLSPDYYTAHMTANINTTTSNITINNWALTRSKGSLISLSSGTTFALTKDYIYEIVCNFNIAGTFSGSKNTAIEMYASGGGMSNNTMIAVGLTSSANTSSVFDMVPMGPIIVEPSGTNMTITVQCRSTNGGSNVRGTNNTDSVIMIKCLGPSDPSILRANGVSF